MAELTLRPGTTVRWIDDRLFIGGWQSSSTVDCPAAFGELWRRLAPLVRQGLDPDVATVGLSTGTAAAVHRLFALLTEHDVLVDVRAARDGHPLTSYLAGVAGHPAAALATVRRAGVAVDGAGEVASAVRAALTASGLSATGADLVVRLVPPGRPEHPATVGRAPAVLPVAVLPDGALIGPVVDLAAPGPGHSSPLAHRWLPYLVVHEVVRTLAGLADGTGLLLRGTTVTRIGMSPRPSDPPGSGPAGRPAPDRQPAPAHLEPTTGPTGHPAAGPVRVTGDDGLVAAIEAALATGPEWSGQPVLVGAAPDWPVQRHDTAQRTAHATGAAYLPVRARATAIEIGPLSRPGSGACFECADTRRRTALGPRDGAALVADGRPLPLPPYLLGLLAELVVGRLADDAGSTAVTVLAVRDATVRRHLVQPVAGCPVCDPLPPDSAGTARIALRPRRQPAPDAMRVAPGPPAPDRLHDELVDGRYGPVVRVHPEQQGPVALAAAELPVPDRADRLGGYGRAADERSATALALLEAVERDAGRWPQARRTTVLGSYRELARQAVDPARLGLPEPDAVRHPGYRLAPYTPDTVTSWVWAYELVGDRMVLVPEHAAYFGVTRPDAARFVQESSSGCAVGSCLEEAALHGCLEVIERDAFLLTWYSGRTPPAVRLPPAPDPLTRQLTDRIAAEGYQLHLFDVTSDIGIPVVWALATTDRPDRGASFSAAGAHPDPRRAAAAAIAEAGVNLARARRAPAPDRGRLLAMLDDPDLVRGQSDHAALHLLPEALPRFDFAVRQPPRPFDAHFAGWRDRWPHPDLTEVLRRVAAAMADAGAGPLVVEQTRTVDRRLGLAAVKVLAPGALPMTFGHLNRRVDLPRLARAGRPGRSGLPHPFP